MRPLVLAALLSAAPAATSAAPTVTCHCFRDRSFDPADPGAADPYILATTRSSLLSAALGPPKADLVRAAMSGTPTDDLWIAHWTAARTGADAGALLDARRAAGSWKAALAGSKELGAAFGAALDAGAPDGALSALAIDDVLVERLGANREDVTLLRAARARSEEVVLAAVLSVHTRRPAMPFLARVRSRTGTWGMVLRDAGLAPERMEGVVRQLVR
jgi:hypothetical protein